jgi:hypothetical protein
MDSPEDHDISSGIGLYRGSARMPVSAIRAEHRGRILRSHIAAADAFGEARRGRRSQRSGQTFRVLLHCASRRRSDRAMAETNAGVGASVDRMSRQPSNHAMERTATRRALTFSLTSVPSFRATLALGGRRSSYSR